MAIVDDQELVLAGFKMIISAEPDLVVSGEARSGTEAVQMVRRIRPDVTLMDIRMPGPVDGLEATRELTRGGAATKIVMLTTFDTDDSVFAALDAGASGFLLKNSPPERMLEAIRIVAGGEALLDPAVTTRVISEFGNRRSRTAGNHGSWRLTEREGEVLRGVASGLSNAEIARMLFLSETTVKTHVAHVLAKVGARDRVQLVVRCYESGFVRPDQPDWAVRGD
ncbi:DNA-binding NarL/FixJ family response regulator [Arthrobacter silviterrae]|nr:DNA-binding NarL/FixJ family response regulator [Arthrobacter silviterrae]